MRLKKIYLGTLLNKRYVMTAMHCVKSGSSTASRVTVRYLYYILIIYLLLVNKTKLLPWESVWTEMLSGRKQSIFGSFQIAKILWNSKFSCHNGMLKKRGGKNQKKFLGVLKLPDKWKVSWKVPNFLSTMGCWKITLGQKPMKLGISQIARHLGNYN